MGQPGAGRPSSHGFQNGWRAARARGLLAGAPVWARARRGPPWTDPWRNCHPILLQGEEAGWSEEARLSPPGGPVFSLALDSREQEGLPGQVFVGNHAKQVAVWVPPAAELDSNVSAAGGGAPGDGWMGGRAGAAALAGRGRSCWSLLLPLDAASRPTSPLL